MDKELITHLRVKSASFKICQLSFCQHSRDVEMGSAESASDRKTQADYNCLKLKLEVESAMFLSHQLAMQEWEHQTASARADRLQQIDNVVETTTKEYCDLRFPVLQLTERDEARETRSRIVVST